MPSSYFSLILLAPESLEELLYDLKILPGKHYLWSTGISFASYQVEPQSPEGHPCCICTAAQLQECPLRDSRSSLSVMGNQPRNTEGQLPTLSHTDAGVSILPFLCTPLWSTVYLSFHLSGSQLCWEEQLFLTQLESFSPLAGSNKLLALSF